MGDQPGQAGFNRCPDFPILIISGFCPLLTKKHVRVTDRVPILSLLIQAADVAD